MPQRLSPAALATLVKPGEVVFVPGTSGRPSAFVESLLETPENSRDLRLYTSLVPGIDHIDLSGLHSSARVTSPFMLTDVSAQQRDGRFRHLPLSYSGYLRHLRDEVDIDLAVIQVAPPDGQGRCSLGPAVEFVPAVLEKCRRVLAIINRHVPRIKGAVSVPYERLDYVCEFDRPLPEYRAGSDAAAEAIAAHVASLVSDGAVLQLGLGRTPAALARHLLDRRNLRLHSGLFSDGLRQLADHGVLDRAFRHTTCVLMGSSELYRWAEQFDGLDIRGCEYTHDPITLTGYQRFTAVNSAIEIDLFGQCNLERLDGRAIGGAGGALDFARAARHSRGGRSIVALKATYGGGTGSRVVANLGEHGLTSLPRSDVDFIVTEFGIANLVGASVHERAEALIAVAAPPFRVELQRQWQAIAARL